MYKETVGIVGGFGGYATLHFYKRILEEFASESERNYPHIYMDNDFTMPSRTRALLYGEEYEVIVNAIAASIKNLISLCGDTTHIVLVCGTAHAFLDDIYKLVPEAKKNILNIIDTTGKQLNERRIKEVLIIAAEGTLKNDIYPKYFEKYDIKCVIPDELYYSEIRYFIESVKRNNLDDEVSERFLKFLEKFQIKNVILGCTEFPVLINYICESKNSENINKYIFIDPLEVTIEELKLILK